MSVPGPSAVRAVLLSTLAMIPIIASAQLNPTVRVLPRSAAGEPAECEQGGVAQAGQRMAPAEQSAVRDNSRDMQAPPSRPLRAALRRAVEAASHNDREEFRDSLSTAQELLGPYPSGRERSAALALVEALADLDKIWEYQFTSETGAFFETESEPFRLMSKYRGFEASIRRQVVVDQNGNRFYPAHESRDFLLNESADRLAAMTGEARTPRSSTAVAGRVSPPVQREPDKRKQRADAQLRTSSTKTSSPAPARHPPAHQREARASTMKAARKSPTPAVRTTTPSPLTEMPVTSPQPQAKPLTPPPRTNQSGTANRSSASPPLPASDNAATQPPSSETGGRARRGSSSPASITTAAAETTSARSSAEQRTASPERAAASGEKPARPRTIFWSILLIVVGVGLLLVLWKAAS